MNDVLFTVLGLKITAWKLVGYAGGFLFTSRWIVQTVASRRAGKPTLPLLFWYMSILGSSLLLLYFIFGKNDSVGIITNSFPFFLAVYNLLLELSHRRRVLASAAVTPPGEVPAEVI